MSWQNAYFKKCQEVELLRAKLLRLQQLAEDAYFALDEFDLSGDEGAMARTIDALEKIIPEKT